MMTNTTSTTSTMWRGAGLAGLAGAIAVAAVSLATQHEAATAATGAPHDAARCEEADRAPSPVGQRWTDPTLSDQWLVGERDRAEGGDGTTLVVFFEVWCPHCRDEMPHLAELDALDGVEVVALTRMGRDTTEEQVRAFAAEHALPFAVGEDTRGLFERAGARGVPAAVALRGGEVVWAGHPRNLPQDELARWTE